MTTLYRSVSSKLPAELRRAAGSLIEFSERRNRKQPPIAMQRITMVIFAAWLREQDQEATGIAAKEWIDAVESAAQCARALTPPQVQALQATLVE